MARCCQAGVEGMGGMVSPSHISRYCVLGPKVIFLVIERTEVYAFEGTVLPWSRSRSPCAYLVLCHSLPIAPSLLLPLFFSHPNIDCKLLNYLLHYHLLPLSMPGHSPNALSPVPTLLFSPPFPIQVHLQLTFLRLPPISFCRISSTVC